MSVSTYPGWHFFHGFAVRTKMYMQNDNGYNYSKDDQADDEHEVQHYTHMPHSIELFYFLYITLH